MPRSRTTPRSEQIITKNVIEDIAPAQGAEPLWIAASPMAITATTRPMWAIVIRGRFMRSPKVLGGQSARGSGLVFGFSRQAKSQKPSPTPGLFERNGKEDQAGCDAAAAGQGQGPSAVVRLLALNSLGATLLRLGRH